MKRICLECWFKLECNHFSLAGFKSLPATEVNDEILWNKRKDGECKKWGANVTWFEWLPLWLHKSAFQFGLFQVYILTSAELNSITDKPYEFVRHSKLNSTIKLNSNCIRPTIRRMCWKKRVNAHQKRKKQRNGRKSECKEKWPIECEFNFFEN